jgi:LemA protein
LRMRFDLVDNLVETVKWYAKHEKGTLKEVIEARNRFTTATDVKWKAEADNMLTTSLKSIFALSESYPELKANQNFLSLQS